MMTANANEIGRTIQTPRVCGCSIGNHTNDYVYKAMLMLPDDSSIKVRNESLVLELDVTQSGGGAMVKYGFKGYQLHREKKTWSDAEAHCKSEGGQLASIHSDLEQESAKRAADGNTVWLGGMVNSFVEWQWSDFSTWVYHKVDSAPYGGLKLSMESNGVWSGFYSHLKFYFLCQSIHPH